MSDVNTAPAAPLQTVSHIINAVPLGVQGFALTTFMLGMYTSGQFNAKGEVIVFVCAAFYGGLTQFIAGFFAAARGDMFPAVFMTAYGAFWLTFVFLNLYAAPRAGSAASQMVTIYLCMWSVITFVFLVVTLWTNWIVFLVFLEFMVTIIVLDFGSALNNTSLNHAGGYLEMILAAAAWYVIGAEMINHTAGKELLPFPLMPLNAGYSPKGLTPLDTPSGS
ncbi:MAG: acetate uptake transporter [Acidimicrobiales bacterium]